MDGYLFCCFIGIVFMFFLSPVVGVCYFPVEFQGIFATQSTLTGGSNHKYSQITILPDAIPVWGVCHELTTDTVILRDVTGGQACFRCFQINLRSPNVIQIYTEGLDKCYTQEGPARASCPTKSDIKNRIAREIMLYKSRSFTRDGLIDKVFCPVNGKFFYTYDVNDGTEHEVECPGSQSTVSNCPQASQLELKFIDCNFRDSTMLLTCLGDWIGHDGYQYFALWDPSISSDNQAQYRCGMYHEDSDTSRVFISFSMDATCTNRLQSPWDGYETMVLTPDRSPSLPAPVHSHSCLFPAWSNGLWKDIHIRGRELTWKDGRTDKVYKTLCLTRKTHLIGERFALYSQNQCGDQEYACIWIKKRAMHVMEFKIAAVQYNYFNDTQICNDDVFIGQEWITQGRFTDSGQTNCPVLGEYTGVIPDDPELCARLSSDCRRPQFMHYAVLSCSNSSLIFEADSWAKSRTKRNNVDHVQKRRRHSREFKEGGRHRNGRNVSQERKEEEDAHFSHFDPSSGDDMKFVRASMRGSSRTYVFPASALNDSSQQNLPPVKPFTTRRPYAYEKPFYYVVDQYGNQVLDLPTSQLVAEREYQCLGQWRETSTVYTFTYRRDVKMYECFAGVVVSSDEAFIIEAGISCKRGLHPLTKGMKLVRKATCDEINNFTKSPSFMNTSVYTTVSNILEVSHTPSQPSLLPAWWPSTSRKPWLKKTTETTDKPLWKRQKPKDASNSSAVMSAELIFIVLLVSTPIWPAL